MFGSKVALAIYLPRFTVTKKNDAGAGSLRQALLDAGSEQEANVVFDESGFFGFSNTITLTSGELTMSGRTRLYGPAAGVKIDANDASRVFNVDASLGGLLLKDLHITRGAAVDGAGVLIDGSSATSANTKLVNCRITVCNASGDGGGVACRKGHVELDGCEFEGNTAGDDGGGIDMNVLFSNNLDRTLTVTGCVFDGCVAADEGGGLAAHRNPTTVVDCVFDGNEADDGGAIYAKDYSLSVFDTAFWNNRADDGCATYYRQPGD